MGKKVSELTSLSEVTDGDFFMVTDDTTGASRRVSWSNVKDSIPTEDLGDLDDVDVTTSAPADGSALIYDSSSGNWVPGDVSEIEGSSPVKGARYTYSSSVSPTGISSGQVRFNSTIPAGTNVMYVHDTDLDGINHTPVLQNLFGSNTVFILRSVSNTSHYVKFAVTSTPTDFGSYFVVSVRHIESVAYPANNTEARFTNANQLYTLEGAQNFTLPEDTASAIDFKQGDDSYLKIDTSSSSKKITVGQDITFSGGIIDTLTLKSDNTNGGSFRIYQGDNNTDAPDVRFHKSRNTVASPSAVNANDALMRVAAYAYTGGSYEQSGNLGILAADTSGNGTFEVKTRSSGTMATRISVDSNGNTKIAGDLIQTPGSSITPASNGDLVVEATNDTTLTFKLKGSDGQVRSGTITLS